MCREQAQEAERRQQKTGMGKEQAAMVREHT